MVRKFLKFKKKFIRNATTKLFIALTKKSNLFEFFSAHPKMDGIDKIISN